VASDVHTVPRTGNDFIDVTHDDLLRRVSDLRRRCACGAGREAVVPDFDGFLGQMCDHFGHEELILRAAGFDAWAEHAERHEELGTQLGRLVDYLRDSDVTQDFLCTVAGTMDSALTRHEITQDCAFASPLNPGWTPPKGKDIIVWDPVFDTGNAAIDAQHRELAELLNRMHHEAQCGCTTARALALMDEVQAHLEAHFAAEEGVMRGGSLSGFVQHHASHRSMEAQFLSVRDRVAAEAVNLSVVARGYLRFWFADHILRSDKPALAAAARPA
jgi:hemerythrin